MYKTRSVRLLEPEILQRHFTRTKTCVIGGEERHEYTINPETKKHVHFTWDNLLASNIPVQNADVVFLRNVLQYFTKIEDKSTIIKKAISALKNDGRIYFNSDTIIHNLPEVKNNVSPLYKGFPIYERRVNSEKDKISTRVKVNQLW